MDVTITFSPPLPCGTTDGDRLCGKPATVAIGYPMGGEWRILPVCADCTKATAQLYQIIDLADELKPDKEVGKDGTNP